MTVRAATLTPQRGETRLGARGVEQGKDRRLLRVPPRVNIGDAHARGREFGDAALEAEAEAGQREAQPDEAEGPQRRGRPAQQRPVELGLPGTPDKAERQRAKRQQPGQQRRVAQDVEAGRPCECGDHRGAERKRLRTVDHTALPAAANGVDERVSREGHRNIRRR